MASGWLLLVKGDLACGFKNARSAVVVASKSK